MSKKERFFWQYNVQAKGPKGQKINLTPEAVDPHVLNKVQDPVFSPYCSVDGIKHRYRSFTDPCLDPWIDPRLDPRLDPWIDPWINPWPAPSRCL